MYRQQGHISHLLHATKSDTSLHILQHTMVHLFGNFLRSGLFTHVCQCKELQKEFRLLFHSHWSYVRGLGAFVGVMMLSSWDPHPIAKIPSDPRSILYRSSDSIPTILQYSDTTLTKTLNPPKHFLLLSELRTTSENPDHISVFICLHRSILVLLNSEFIFISSSQFSPFRFQYIKLFQYSHSLVLASALPSYISASLLLNSSNSL